MDIVVKFVDKNKLSYGLYRLVKYKDKFVWEYINKKDRDGLFVCGNLLNDYRDTFIFDSIEFMEGDLENLC